MSLLDGEAAVASASLPGGTSDAVLSVGSPKLWWPVGMGSGPFLYSLHVATPTDSFRTRVGLREVAVAGRELRVNGAPVYLRGTDYHTDAPLRGHGVDGATIARDAALMRSVGLNAFRTNSWPVT